MTPTRVHVDVLGWLHTLWGLFGVLVGISLVVIAAGVVAGREAAAAVGPSLPAIILLAGAGAAFTLGGLVMALVGRALLARRPGGRLAALVAALPNLLIVPFGTALAGYACWVLLNDEARAAFGRPPRAGGWPPRRRIER